MTNFNAMTFTMKTSTICSICREDCGRATVAACMTSALNLQKVAPGHYETAEGHEVRKTGSRWYFRRFLHGRDDARYTTLRQAASELYRDLAREEA